MTEQHQAGHAQHHREQKGRAAEQEEEDVGQPGADRPDAVVDDSTPPVDENAASSGLYVASDTSITSATTPMAMTALSRSPRETAAVKRFCGLVRS